MKTAYPNVRDGATITLFRNIPFDNTYQHHSLISDLFHYNHVPIYTGRTAQEGLPCERFLNIKSDDDGNYIYPRTTKSGEFNFDYGNGLITKVVMELTPAETNSNYMKVVCGSDIYYYFITSIIQQNYDTYQLSLELDVLMTYQDEFLQGMDSVPVFTKRKHSHRYTNDGLVPYCADFRNNEDAFRDVSPSIITNIIQKHYKSLDMTDIEGLQWLYLCVENKNQLHDREDNKDYDLMYCCKKKTYPFSIMVVPIGDYGEIIYRDSTDYSKSCTFTKDDINQGIRELIGAGKIHGCKISPYPPFNCPANTTITTIKSSGSYIIQCSNISTLVRPYGDNQHNSVYRMNANNNKLIYGNIVNAGELLLDIISTLLKYGFMLLLEQNDCSYDLEGTTLNSLGLINAQAPTINSHRYNEPKLLFSPFKKYVLTAQYSVDAYEFFPCLELSQYYLANNSSLFDIKAYGTGYIGDDNYYIEIYKDYPSHYGYGSYANLKYAKVGLTSSINYSIPCGTNALDVFNATQKQSFYTSKVASGITSGLTMAGGFASIGIGNTLRNKKGELTTGGSGMLATGITGVASGVVGIAESIASSVAKIKDLKNTPDSFNIIGSNYQFDDAVNGDTRCLPYIIIYDVPQVIKDNANDYFYRFGYQVARNCYFNTELKYDASSDFKVDDNLFGRTLFNYIQINEDITNKIRADIPLIAKKKISSILNEGITFWSFYGFNYIWKQTNQQTITTRITNWFMNDLLDNTEYSQ